MKMLAKIKNAVIYALLVFMIPFGLAGCGGGGNEDNKPSAPTNLTVEAEGDGCVSLHWDFDYMLAIEYFELQINSEPWKQIDGYNYYTEEGLVNGVTYSFRVRMVTLRGTSPASNTVTGTPVAPPPTAPSEPTNVTYVVGDGEVTFTWDAPLSDGGSPILYYELSKNIFFTDIEIATSPHTVTDLINGLDTYYFSLYAVNSVGKGQYETLYGIIPLASAPSNFTAESRDGAVLLTWDKIENNTRGYQVKVNDGEWKFVYYNAYLATELTNGTEYSFAVRGVTWNWFTAESTAAATPLAGSLFVPTAPNIISSSCEVKWSNINNLPSIIFKWDAPVDDGGSPITGYEIWLTGDTEWSAYNFTYKECTSLEIGVEYTFKVRAINAVGTSPVAEIKMTTTLPVPVRPSVSNISAVDEKVTFYAATSSGIPVDYFEAKVDDGEWMQIPQAATITGLVNGVEYTISVRAINSAGSSTVRTFTVTPIELTPPSEPRNLTAAGRDASVYLTWQAPSSNGGDPITHYQLQVDDGEWTDIGNVLSYTKTGLTNGTTYSFKIRAVNSLGESTASEQKTAIPGAVPSMPLNFTAVGGNNQVVLSWQAPDSNGGLAITGYEIQTDGGSWTPVGNVLTYTVTGLTNGTSYTFRVRAVNAMGNGTQSDAKNASPKAPSALATDFVIERIDAYNNEVRLTWLAKSGSSVYEVSDDGSYWYMVTSAPGATYQSYLFEYVSAGEHTFYIRLYNNDASKVAVTATMSVAGTGPTAPLNPTATLSGTELTIEWDAPYQTLTGYQVRIGESGAWTNIGNVLEYSQTVSSGSVIYVRAVNGANPGDAIKVSVI